jgi:hypothetical protein
MPGGTASAARRIGGLPMGVELLADPKAVKRLADLCGRLGSDMPGERDNAAVLATRHIQALGLTWSEVIERALTVGTKPVRRPSPRPSACDWPAKIRWLLACRQYLSAWERGFVDSLHRRVCIDGLSLTPGQVGKLLEVVGRVEQRCGGATP